MLEETSSHCTFRPHRRSLRLLPLQCPALFVTEVRPCQLYSNGILFL